ncbi:hypothetical protein B0H13DRAFT_2009555 [Mycena leptocephala]|nr:hypothetical protein B0H13DRAFT_2009555 [Mycena leptocephala]
MHVTSIKLVLVGLLLPFVLLLYRSITIMSLPRTMRAVVCPSVPISPTQLVYTTSFGLNRSELYTRQGLSPGLVFPRVLGIECVGIVKDAGGGKWKEGGYAEYTLVPHASVSPPIELPKNVGWDTFAAIPETFMTAWGTLHSALNLKSTDSLFIHGGTSSVGLACASLAKSSLGADHVILDTGSVSAEVKRLTGGVGATKAVELVGPPALEDSCAALSPDGSEFDPLTSLAPSKHLTMFGSGTVNMSTAPLQQIVDAVGSGEIKLHVDKVFDIVNAGEAHAYMEANAAAGKVVCLVD